VTEYTKKVYLDYAASTPLCKESREAMENVMQTVYANPSAVHALGRAANVCIEQARSTVADCLHCGRENIIFTSGATEAINLTINNICADYSIKTLISSPLEHSAVIHTLQHISKTKNIPLLNVEHDKYGNIDNEHLTNLLAENSASLVVLMHGNNETGQLTDIEAIGQMCRQYNALFFCDMVQTIGKYELNLPQMNVDFAVGTAHKFYGPKGTGILYLSKKVSPLLLGGAQERNIRAGTENIYGIVGTAAALNAQMSNVNSQLQHIQHIKKYCIEKLLQNLPQIIFVGNCQNGGMEHIINFYLPDTEMDILSMQLDMAGIALSSGSACSSGTERISHVINALNINSKTLRLSFGKQTSTDDIDFFIQNLILFI
jgi:cysteine desulfurase